MKGKKGNRLCGTDCSCGDMKLGKRTEQDERESRQLDEKLAADAEGASAGRRRTQRENFVE